MINTLHKCGLCLSFDSIQTLIKQLALLCIILATWVAYGPHAPCWDNINMKTLIFVEQRGDIPAKVQLGTMAVLY